MENKLKTMFEQKTTNRTYRCVHNKKKIGQLEGTIGESGYQSRYLPHAKLALYHLS